MKLRRAFSMTEMISVIAILGIIVAIIIPRLAGSDVEADRAACQANRGNIEIQAELWRSNRGAWPTASLSDIGSDLNYFPAGLPTCPVDGAPYAIDSGGRAVGHVH